jgi:glyoxylase-like metal-dependent hydrolase (beta-lactamase superfamily II)
MAAKIPYRYEFDFEYGKIQQLSPLVRRVVAQNPNPFTFHGTNSYILGTGEVALIDPGPNLESHVSAIETGLKDETISHILITHSHDDHWPACVPLQKNGAGRTVGYHPQAVERPDLGDTAGDGAGPSQEEQFDEFGFVPQVSVFDGEIIEGGDWSVECVFTPGHAPNHLCFRLQEENILFTGDHVMGWSTSVISPPSGNMADYRGSLDRLLKRDETVYWPAHGPCIDDPKPFVQAFIEHRQDREDQILAALAEGYDNIVEMVPHMYHDVAEILHPAAARSVFAAMIYLVKRGKVMCMGEVSIQAKYRLP